jgi:hypothetical protein
VLDQRNQLSAVDRTRAIEALIADLSRSLTLHCCARSHAYELASNAIRSLSMKRIGALAQRWFAAKQQFEMGLLADQSVNFSLRLLEEPFQTSGGSVVQLLSRSELRHEARQLQHCVENYSEACAKGRSLIFSIRNQSGESRSTVELSISERGLSRYSIDVVQHKGIGNTAPTVEDAVVLKSFLEFLRGPFLRSQLRVFCITRNFANIHASSGASAVKEYQLSLLLSKTLADASRGQIVFDSLLEKTIKNAMGENC